MIFKYFSRERFSSAWNSYPKDYMGLILLAWAIPAIYTLVNIFFIGKMEMEAVAISEQYENVGVILEILLEMFPLAVLALVARNFTDTEKVANVVKSAFVMQLLITVAFMLLIIFGASFFVDAINTPQEIQARSEAFLQVKAIAMPFEALSVLFIISIKAMKKGNLAVGIASIGVILNVVMDVLVISDFSFSLKLGLMGSAWDYVVTKIIIFAVSAFLFYRLVKAKPDIRFDKKEVKAILRIGKYTGMESAVRNAGYIFGVLIVLNTLGVAEYGGYGVAMTIMWLIFLIPVLSLTEATNVAVGNEYGKKNLDGMRNVQFVSIVLMGSYMVLATIIGIFAWRPLSSFFNQSQEIVDWSTATFYFLAIPYIIFAISSGLKSLFIGTGKTLYYLIPSICVNLGIYIPVGIMVKTNAYLPSFSEIMIISFVVFALDLIITLILVKKQYRELQTDGFALQS